MKWFTVAVFAVLFCLTGNSPAQKFKVIHSFKGPPVDGDHAIASVVFDSAGNMYGTTPGGGNSQAAFCNSEGCGTVFELSPQSNGTWKETILHNFCSDFENGSCQDGAYPYAGLTLDSAGNLYGTTLEGGKNCSPGGCGTVFELSPSAGTWTETVLYNFCSNAIGFECLDGWQPTGQMIFDAAGNLYGTTFSGGSGLNNGGGTVFELSPGPQGWTETVLYNFCSVGQGTNCVDGYSVWAGPVFDRFGNLYGTTTYSGNESTPAGGTVYELVRNGSSWTYKLVLNIPPGSKSNTLSSKIVFDPSGNLIGSYTIPDGGVFHINTTTKKVEVFSFNGTDGMNPQSGVYLDSQGTIYGTTALSNGSGNVYRISPQGKETVLHNFCSSPNCDDGTTPWAVPVPDSAGNLYGTTEFGGTYDAGVVFEIKP